MASFDTHSYAFKYGEAGGFTWFSIYVCLRSHHFLPNTRSVHNDWLWKHLELIEFISIYPPCSRSLFFMVNWTERPMCLHAKVQNFNTSMQCAARVYCVWQLLHKMVCKRMHQIAFTVDKYQFAMFSSQHTVIMMISYKCKLQFECSIHSVCRSDSRHSVRSFAIIIFFVFFSFIWCYCFRLNTTW